ncbi:ABC transporter ATP-binding protein [Kitasatospora aureofaciens]|uniref:ABC transporter ATP-binding protein n=1 Tax=Kitasatospora aureofaciens TaxID=1894 RepID=UPI0033C89DCD
MTRKRYLRSVLRRFLTVAETADPAVVPPAPPVPLREVFQRFWPYTRGGRRWLVVLLALVAVAPAIEVAEIWLFKIVIDDMLIPHRLSLFFPIALAYALLALLSGVLGFADRVTSTWVSERFLLILRSDVFRHLQGLSLGFFERRRLGDVLSRVTGDVDAVETFLLSGLVSAVSQAMRLGIYVGVLLVLRWELTLTALVAAPLFFLTARRFAKLIRAASRERRRRAGSISAVTEESLGNIALVQAYNRQDWEHARFQRESVGRYHAAMASARIGALYGPTVDFIELLGGMVVMGLGAWELVHGRLTLGGLMVFLALLSRLYGPIQGMSGLGTTFYAASAAAERIIELLDQRPQVSEAAAPRAIGRTQGEIEFDDVTFRYPETEVPALSGVSFKVAPGEMLALVGASGAGKSTVAKLLLRFYDPHGGTVRLDGLDLRELALTQLRENVAVVLQETLVFHGTVRENIAYGRPEASEAEIRAAARAADAHGFISLLPDGYDTVVGQRGRLLSGGQRQRLAIARAMIRDAPVLVLDEPTTGLDAESARRIMGPLRLLMAGRTTVIISHNLLTVRDANQIVLLEQGRLAAHGTHDELIARSPAYAALHRLHHPPDAPATSVS